MQRAGSSSTGSLPQTILLALPFVIYLYPAIALLMAKSRTPLFFNMYSANLLLLNVTTVLAYFGFLFGLIAGWRSIQFAAVLILAVIALVATNNSVLGLWTFDVITQTVRVFAGLALIVLAYLAEKRGDFRFVGVSLVIGAIVSFSAIVDLGFASISRIWGPNKLDQVSRYRTAYDLTKVTGRDVVLVGDSFVWGWGVRTDQRFGDVLERRLDTQGMGPRVYSLGISGADVRGYIRQIRDLPETSKVKQVVLCFYANDMPPRINLQDTLQQLTKSIGSRSVTLRTAINLFQIAVTPSPQAYANLLLTHYLENDPTFDIRWQQLRREFEEFFRLASARSYRRPIIIIIPMLVDFETDEFAGPMRRVSDLAASAGYQVLDTMPAFQADGENAERYRAEPNDLHLNERGNKIIAEVLFRAVSNKRRHRHDWPYP